MSGRAVEAAGDVDVLLLDKTGTITLGNRQATEFIPAPGVTERDLADAAQLASLADETPEGRSVVVLAKKFGIRERQIHELPQARFVAFTAQTRMSGVDLDGIQYRKGAAQAIRQFAPLNIMGLHSPASAILSAVIFNALIIIALIPLALRGVRFRPIGAAAILRRNLLIYGLGGLIVPFVGIKLIDVLITTLNLI